MCTSVLGHDNYHPRTFMLYILARRSLKQSLGNNQILPSLEFLFTDNIAAFSLDVADVTEVLKGYLRFSSRNACQIWRDSRYSHVRRRIKPNLTMKNELISHLQFLIQQALLPFLNIMHLTKVQLLPTKLGRQE